LNEHDFHGAFAASSRRAIFMKRAALLALMALYPASCMATTTGDFVAKWEELRKNPDHLSAQDFGQRADVQSFIHEFGDAASTLRKKLDDAKSRNQPVDICPPHEVKLGIDAILADARALPAAWQSRPFADSFAQIMKNHYPCPAPAP